MNLATLLSTSGFVLLYQHINDKTLHTSKQMHTLEHECDHWLEQEKVDSFNNLTLEKRLLGYIEYVSEEFIFLSGGSLTSLVEKKMDWFFNLSFQYFLEVISV